MNSNDENRYSDIINLPHHVSETRPHMSRLERAAQFSPFAALTGYNAAIKETERYTDKKIELGEYELEKLNDALQQLEKHLSECPKVNITYFKKDPYKQGGTYINISRRLVKINSFEQYILLDDGSRISFDNIRFLEPELF